MPSEKQNPAQRAAGRARNGDCWGAIAAENSKSRNDLQSPFQVEERALIACDFIAEAANLMVSIAATLMSAACAADLAAIEVDLWRMRRTLMAAIKSWREAVPSFESDGGKV